MDANIGSILDEYYNNLEFIRLNEISSGLGSSRIFLLDLVVPLRSDISISAEVNETGVERVLVHPVTSDYRNGHNVINAICTISQNGNKVCIEPKKGTDRRSFYSNRTIEINDDFIDAVYNGTQKILDGRDVNGLTVRPRSYISSPLWSKGYKNEIADIQIISAANIYKYVVILGAPGSGKTTTAKAIVVAHYKAFFKEKEHFKLEDFGFWGDPDRLPIYIDLKSFVSDESFPDITQQPSITNLKKYLKKEICKDNPVAMDYLLSKLQSGSALFVFDGLDEVPVPRNVDNALEKRHDQISSLIQSIKTVYRGVKIIVTSRPAGYSGWTLNGFSVIHIRPLSSEEAVVLAKSYYLAAGEQEGAEDIANRFMTEVKRLPSKIREYPLFIGLLAAIFRDKKGVFPAKRGGLLQVSIESLLDSWTVRRFEGQNLNDILHCTTDDLVRCLSQISYRVLRDTGDCGISDTPGIPLSIALEEFYNIGSNINIRKVLDYMEYQAGILYSASKGQLRFVHRLFQEYLAALAISEKDDSISVLVELLKENPKVWREVALLFADILSNSRQRDAEKIILVESLLNTVKSCQDSIKEDIISIATNIIVDDEFSKLNSTYKQSGSIKSCISILLGSLDESYLSGKTRELVGLALNELGDPRIGVSVDENGIPEFLWQSIPAGKVKMGTSEEEQRKILIDNSSNWSFEREQPQCIVDVESFDISCYLVTKKQFESFVAAPDGYGNDTWWTQAGLRWKEKSAPPSTSTSESYPDNAPQNYVTWYEAVAFCNWYSYKTGDAVRLPTEAEWEYAAKGSTSNQFVWGDDYNIAYANVAETDVHNVVSVGCFPCPIKSHKNIKLCDMNGNLWEWCSSIVEENYQGHKYGYPYDKLDGREDIEKGDGFLRASRGGYYYGQWMQSRNAYRGRDVPFNRVERQGFRVVRNKKKEDN